MRSALQLRRSLSIAREDAVNVYDIATAIGVDVRFLDRPSLEGMFVRDPDPVVLLPSRHHRPRGRISFSCAHELGHFQLGHGTKVDEDTDEDQLGARPDDEYAADTFASSLLMPRQAVLQRFALRDLRPAEADAITLFAIAGELDVGFGTLLNHMRFGLEIVTDTWLAQRRRITPKQLKAEILGTSESTHVVIVTEHWPQAPIDLEIDDVIAVPVEIAIQLPSQLTALRTTLAWQLFVATKVASGTLRLDSKIHSVRVARAGYCGCLRYRFLADSEVE
jgi:Zn-dependent peptidase ImmA (M78 family)